jgi:hypothetical protein
VQHPEAQYVTCTKFDVRQRFSLRRIVTIGDTLCSGENRSLGHGIRDLRRFSESTMTNSGVTVGIIPAPDAHHVYTASVVRRLGSDALTNPHQRLSGASSVDWPPVSLRQKMQSVPSSRGNFLDFFCINTRFVSPLSMCLHPLIPCPFTRCYVRFAPPFPVIISETRRDKGH